MHILVQQLIPIKRGLNTLVLVNPLTNERLISRPGTIVGVYLDPLTKDDYILPTLVH